MRSQCESRVAVTSVSNERAQLTSPLMLCPIWVGLCLARAFHGITGLTDGTVHEAVCQVYAGVTLQFVMAARENNQTHDASPATSAVTEQQLTAVRSPEV
ncbi:hypothetical protein LSAT2_020588 [Lamellibrachia satsuma]|nr:hypothetical protein LSAT2_020588 [Lamellibrachia satsuma]